MNDKFQVIHKTNRNVGSYGPAVIERIKTFCEAYDSDVKPDDFAAHLMEQMTLDMPYTLVIAGVDEGNVFGHLIASVEQFYGGEPLLMILQIEIDKEWEGERKALYDAAFPVILGWAARLGCKKIRIWGRNREVADKFADRFGFVDTGRVLMERDIEGLQSV